LLIFNN